MRTRIPLVLVGALLVARSALAAENLRLAPGLSFTDDASDRFPIEGERLGDAVSDPERATVVFFGAAHCWNTNREAERLVAVYPRFRNRLNFVIVDVGHPSAAQRPLLAAHYHGSIPTLAVLAKDGTVLYGQAGETASDRGDTRPLAALLGKAVGSPP